jgi:uncharacterized membrane protein YphA (DoxX/SURF4 family)
MSVKSITTWALRLLAAGLLLQTLFFKFTAADESVYIFSKLGIEPWGRIASGIMEAIAAVLILVPRTTAYGALLAVGIMAGAIASHIFILGIEVMNDGGQLFIYALLVFVASLILLVMQRRQLFFYQSFFKTA